MHPSHLAQAVDSGNLRVSRACRRLDHNASLGPFSDAEKTERDKRLGAADSKLFDTNGYNLTGEGKNSLVADIPFCPRSSGG